MQIIEMIVAIMAVSSIASFMIGQIYFSFFLNEIDNKLEDITYV